VSGEQAGSPIADTFAIVARKNSAILVSPRFFFTVLENYKFFLALDSLALVFWICRHY
jgi:hypothetical protein